MNWSVETKPALRGLAFGAVALAIARFSWARWMSGGKDGAAASTRAGQAVSAALAPACVERFQPASDGAAGLVELEKVDSGSQGEFIEQGGWADLAGSKPSELPSSAAKACAVLLVGA